MIRKVAKAVARAAATVAVALSWSVQAHAQPAPPAAPASRAEDAPDEIIVRGRRSLSKLRIEAEAARERVWDVFNEINSDDDFDITCLDARKTGSHVSNRVCRPAYADRATSKAGKELAREIQRRCDPTDPPTIYVPCLEGAMARSSAKAQGDVGMTGVMDKRLDEEFRRLATTNPELATAIVEFLQKKTKLEDAIRDRQR